MAGITALSACGRMISRIDCHAERPSALAASPCPLATACRPPRTFSAMYADEKSVSATSALLSALMRSVSMLSRSGTISEAM